MGLLRDVLLLEKVAKSDIDDALNNQNVLVGAEFEFKILPFLDKYKKKINNYNKLMQMDNEFRDYDDALEMWIDASDGDDTPLPTLPQWAKDEGFEDGDEIPDPEELFPDLIVNDKKLWDKLVKEFIPVKKLPFSKSNYIVTDDHTVKSSTKWVIKPDGSLGLSGVEIVTPVLPINEFLDLCPKMFTFINNIEGSSVDEDCGFHISVSLKNIKNLGKSLDVTKLSMFLDEGYIYNFFKTREFNSFAKSAFEAVSSNMIGDRAPELIEKMIDTDYMEEEISDEIKREYPNSHYMAINIEHLKTANEYIEFRYIGAANYHRRWDRIKVILAHYVYNLSLSCDPTFKKKEYHNKMSRLLNKIQLFSVVVEMNRMIREKEVDINEIHVPKKWKDLWKTWKSLYLYKEAIDKDTSSVSAKRGFNNLCRILKVNPDNLIWDFSKYKH